MGVHGGVFDSKSENDWVPSMQLQAQSRFGGARFDDVQSEVPRFHPSLARMRRPPLLLLLLGLLLLAQRADAQHRRRVPKRPGRTPKAAGADYYKILGVPRSADDRAIKKAFRKQALARTTASCEQPERARPPPIPSPRRPLPRVDAG